ncbi:MAG TPA: ABC transporter permease [Bdellovibrionales bacterium]|nr:ABC transporter permease [Bdellovibrionales bacterium]
MTFIARRLALALPALIGVAIFSFLLIHFIPGDPVDIMLGDQASAADREALRHAIGLDLPLTQQFVNYAKGLARFDLGTSLMSGRKVNDVIATHLQPTLELAFAAFLLALCIGLPLGVLAARFRDRMPDRALKGFSLLGTSAPSYWTGPILVYLFALKLNWLPISERDGFENLILPAFTLSLGLSAVLVQITRAAMLETLSEDFIRTARAKGVPEIRVYFRHALANASVPVATVIGLQLGALLTGTVIVETIFDWPGIGTLLYQSISRRDYPVVQGCILLIAVTYVLVNVLTEIVQAALHPRMREAS